MRGKIQAYRRSITKQEWTSMIGFENMRVTPLVCEPIQLIKGLDIEFKKACTIWAPYKRN